MQTFLSVANAVMMPKRKTLITGGLTNQ